MQPSASILSSYQLSGQLVYVYTNQLLYKSSDAEYIQTLAGAKPCIDYGSNLM